MKSSLAYIDDTLDRAVKVEKAAPRISDAERKKAAAESTKVVAGFHLKDEAAERKALDAMIEGRRGKLVKFIEDREAARAKLRALDITPLAIVPLSAWDALCRRAGLFLLWTDERGQINVSRDAFKGYGDAAEFAKVCKKNWPSVLDKLFPDRTVPGGNHIRATLVMPQPPADVAGTLIKASGLALKVAAVAEAIGFKETPAQLYRNELAKREEEIRYQEWLRNDPIIYHEYGTAAAVIAQFGDFPIEKQIVDAVAASDDLIPVERAKAAVSRVAFEDMSDLYQRAINDLMQRQMGAQNAQWIGLAGSTGR